MQEDGTLHEVLNARAFHLLQKLTVSLLPRSEVDLCDMGHQRTGTTNEY